MVLKTWPVRHGTGQWMVNSMTNRSNILKMKIGLAARLTLLSVFVLILQFPTVSAISDAQRKVFDIGINYFDTEVGSGTGCGPSGQAISNTLPATIPAGYADLFNKAAAKYTINPQFLAALFLDEHSNTWLPFSGPWASSPVGASGPFQFMPGTWSGYKVDGNNDGVTDIQNIYDAAYSAANMVKDNKVNASTPLGNLQQPFTPGTFVYFSAVYNYGGGNVQSHTNPNSPLSAVPAETQNYMTNTYQLITSGFTKGSDQNGVVKDQSKGQTTNVAGTSINAGTDCSAGVVSGSVVQTALNFAWDTAGHGLGKADAKPAYQVAMPQYNGNTTDNPYSDCGVFVSTVMIASGADTEFPKRFTPSQQTYLLKSSKYQQINAISTADLQPGDIFSSNHHTYFYVGSQPGGYSAVGASLGDHVPQNAGSPEFTDSKGETFKIFRLKGTQP